MLIALAAVAAGALGLIAALVIYKPL